MYTIKEVAGFLKIGISTLYRMANSKEINSVKIGGSIRFTKRNLADYLEIPVEDICI